MRRIASSRLMGGPTFSSSSRHTSAGSRSSNGLRKLAGAPVTGKFGFCGESDIEGEELIFDICQSYEQGAYFRVEADEGKYFRVARKASRWQPDGPRIVLHLWNALHFDT